MKVRCIDNWFYEHLLKRNEAYEVIRETSDSYIIVIEGLGYLCVDKERFEIIEEDKMKEVRIVRKLEDLDWLENGMGLRINACDVSDSEDYKDINVTIHMESWRVAEIKGPIEIKIEQLNSMGFKFEYKPLRSLVEVYKEMGKNSLCGYKKGVYGVALKDNGIYEICNSDYLLGQFIFEKEQAQKYADELNEIIGVGK